MNGHVRATCNPPCDEMKGCNACNLYICRVCGGAEGTLPTECPGTKMLEEHAQLVYTSTLDFRGGQWMRRSYERWEKTDIGAEIVVDAVAKRLNQERNHAPHQHAPRRPNPPYALRKTKGLRDEN